MATKRRLGLAVLFLAGGRSSTYGWSAAIMHKTPFQLPYKLLSVGSRGPACYRIRDIENTSWKVLAYGIYARVVDVSEIERVSAANE